MRKNLRQGFFSLFLCIINYQQKLSGYRLNNVGRKLEPKKTACEDNQMVSRPGGELRMASLPPSLPFPIFPSLACVSLSPFSDLQVH